VLGRGWPEKSAPRFLLEMAMYRSHFVEYNPEGKQIGTRIKVFALGLLWRHVSNRAQGRAGTGQMFLYEGALAVR